MKLSDTGLRRIGQAEGLRLVAYKDRGGVWTIGYGHTGPEVGEGLTCTPQQALEWLRGDAAWASAAADRHVAVPLAQDQYDILVCFVFNVGETQFARSNLLRKLNDADYAGAAAELSRWVHNETGAVDPDLVARRAVERSIFERDIEGPLRA